MELVDILLPPTFKKSGQVKTLSQAWNDEDWIGTFNLWILQSKPVSSIIYQLRSPKSSWAPKKLDVTAGGHYEAGERISQGIREVKEELGKTYRFKDLRYFGRKLHVGPDTKNRMRQNVVDIFMVIDNSSLQSYVLQASEVYAICLCPLEDLKKVHLGKQKQFTASGIDFQQQPIQVKVTKNSFPYNWDNYHYKIVLLAERFLRGEKGLIY